MNGTDPHSDGTDPYGSDGSSPGSGLTGTEPPGTEPPGTEPPGESGVDTLYRAVLQVARLPGVVVPALTVMVEERRGGGWTGAARVNPRLASAEAAFDTLLRDGLVPGSAVLVSLVLSVGSRYEGVVVRSWPSVVTSVSTRWWHSENSNREAFAGITFRDPLSYLRSRTIWATYANCSLGEILGGALSSAAGGDGRPTRAPVLPGMSAVHIGETLRDGIGEVPYAIAAGEPMGYWLSGIFGRLGVRPEMRGDATGRLVIDLHDGTPSESRVNGDGGVWMTVNPRAVPSATNLVLDATGTGPGLPARGALLDDPASGGVKRFGRPGPVDTVVAADGTDAAEAEKRATFGRARVGLSRVRVSMKSRQPGLLPGRVVRIGIPPHLLFGGRYQGWADGYVTLFGANEWQVADVSHLYSHGGYWNTAEFEKIGAGWRPAVPPEESVKFVSGVVDDGESDSGVPIERDRLGRIPVKLPFFFEARGAEARAPEAGAPEAGAPEAGAPEAGAPEAGAPEAGAPEADAPEAGAPEAGDVPWPPTLLLAPVQPVAGNAHGFVRDHRQGDWCRVAVVNPFYAEIVGFGWRDDRYLSARVSDATMGMVVRQGPEEWRGMLFRPNEDLEQELEDPGSRDASGSEDEDS